MLNRLLYISVLLIIIGANSSCKKFLDAKPDQRLVVPHSLKDLQALMDNDGITNGSDFIAGEASADNYYVTDSDWASLEREAERRLYTWEKDYVFNEADNEWTYAYAKIYRTNTVLDRIDQIAKTPSNLQTWNDVKGQALFIRSYAFLQAVTLFSEAYDVTTASSDLGIPLRLKANFTDVSRRASVEETYDLIIANVKEAMQLLPLKTIHVIRPTKAAAYALLARVYLSMRKYEQVALYADSSLQLYNTLIDYNTINADATYPFEWFNKEYVSYGYNGAYYSSVSATIARIDSNLYQSYNADDIRKSAFFRNNNDGTYSFKGSYMGHTTLFLGISTAEVYLMRAEANARLNNLNFAIEDLNTLLAKRWKTNSFTPLAATTKEEVLDIILQERRKELVMRGLRWMDIKRFNKEGANITLTRIINGKTYTLPPNDPRYALAIPEDVIKLSGMTQNPR